MWAEFDEPSGSHFVPGKSQRYSGMLDSASHSTFLAGYSDPTDASLWRPMDFDGDGLNDLLLAGQVAPVQVFYGRPGLFADGFDPSQADAPCNTAKSVPVGRGGGPRRRWPRRAARSILRPSGTGGLSQLRSGPLARQQHAPLRQLQLPGKRSRRTLGRCSLPRGPETASGNPRSPAAISTETEPLTYSRSRTCTRSSAVRARFSGSAPQIHVHYGVLAAHASRPCVEMLGSRPDRKSSAGRAARRSRSAPQDGEGLAASAAGVGDDVPVGGVMLEKMEMWIDVCGFGLRRSDASRACPAA